SGGMAIYGGVIGGAGGVLLYCLIHKKNFLKVADVAVVGLILGQAIGRIGCYFSSCCYGIEVTNPSHMWFPFATQINGIWHYSTFFYESFCGILLFVLLLVLLHKLKKPGSIMACYLMGYGLIRCVIETFRGDSLYIGPIKVSQLLSGILVLAGIILMVLIYTIRKRKNNEDKGGNISH
ncbi:MAG: prolipoprotein diacylglyceryl transferase, partial [Clostridia bacterium]|nr:prolipoprotein diacylglyceryl transferase [Clostridia bacterium]